MKANRVSTSAKIGFSLVFGLVSVAWIYPSQDGKLNEQNLHNSSVATCIPTSARQTENKVIVDSAAQQWAQFQDLRKEWLARRGVLSSITEMSMLEPYQKIIGMGPNAIPLILAQLRAEGDEPDQWFWALRTISGENPIKPQDQGDFRAMAKAWIEWGEAKDSLKYAG